LIPGLAVVSLAIAEVVDRSPFVTRVGEFVEQPIPFSHQHHVGEIGIDCRYCHKDVESGPSAGLPSAEVCMSCHSQIWSKAEPLQGVRESFKNSTPIIWQRVNRLPDYVYFNHSIHINKGVSCVNCHGAIETMPLTARAESLEMQFCLNCHREPAGHLSSKSNIFLIGPRPDENNPGLQESLIKLNHIEKKVDCTTCHR
jgi:hypothetical protein